MRPGCKLSCALGLGVLLLGVASPAASSAADVAAIEVSAPPPDSSSTEVTDLQRLSLRPTGVPIESGMPAQDSPQTDAPPLPAGREQYMLYFGDTYELSAEVFEDEPLVSTLYQQAIDDPFRYGELPWTPWDPTCACDFESAAQWRIFGELGAGIGSNTFADNDYQEFSLTEELTTCGGREYSFYQRYEQEHTYVNSGELTVGATQEIPDALFNGELKLREEFKLYRDHDFPANDRQEGLFEFELKPESADGRTRGELEYRYNIREYETFSPLSYRLHRGKVSVAHDFSADVTGAVRARIDDYNYSLGSTRDNRRTEFGTEWRFRLSPETELEVSAESEQKDYNVRRERDYDKDTIEATLNWEPTRDTQLSLRGSRIDYQRIFAPDRSYEESALEARYRQRISARWEARAGMLARDKQFTDPFDDLAQQRTDIGLVYNPDQDWQLHLDMTADDYDYANASRAFERRSTSLGAAYSRGSVSLSAEVARDENTYRIDAQRNFTRDRFSLDGSYSSNCYDFRAYVEFGLLDQANPASVNDYDEFASGAEWTYHIDPCTDFVLSYDASRRNYEFQPGIRDTLIEARLRFEL